MIAQRFRACALAELGDAEWQQAFLDAKRGIGGRDRGLLGLEFAYSLIRTGHEAAARDVLAQAATDLRGDANLLTLALANLGISCLRLGELVEAEHSLRQAVKVGQHPEGRLYLSTAWRGLGGLYLRLGQFARAAHAYEMAQVKAETPDDRSKAMRSAAWVAQRQGRLNDAMILLHEVFQHDRVADGQPHPAYADLAVLRLLASDLKGAAQALVLVPAGSLEDRWRAGVVQAELRRLGFQEGGSQTDIDEELRALNCSAVWAQQEADIFPKLFALLGIRAQRPTWEAVVYADGPVRVMMNGSLLPLKATRPAAALLALLLLNGNRVSSERALDAISLRGATPRARRQELSRAIQELRVALGWREALSAEQGVIALSPEVDWQPLVLPPPERAETFCEGRYDRWILEWRDEQQQLNFSAFT
ncbi:hypothetical protein GCM10022631_37490 [Deinococcus rubellus]